MKFSKKKENSTLDLSLIAEFIIEEYRFMNTYSSAVNKLFIEEKKRFISALTFHKNKVNELLEKFGLRAISYQGQDYNEGLPFTPLNADEFADDFNKAHLIIEQTYDPAIITLDGNIVRQGTVSLARKNEEPQENINNDLSEDKK